jgi:hypothetical protein
MTLKTLNRGDDDERSRSLAKSVNSPHATRIKRKTSVYARRSARKPRRMVEDPVKVKEYDATARHSIVLVLAKRTTRLACRRFCPSDTFCFFEGDAVLIERVRGNGLRSFANGTFDEHAWIAT